MNVAPIPSTLRLERGHRHALPCARRADPEDLLCDVRRAATSPIVNALLETADTALLVLTPQRQVVAFNAPGQRGAEPTRCAGLRPGELLSCANARSPGGCGTIAACETCGALGAILQCQLSGRPVEAECLLTTEIDGASASLELNVRATPIHLDEAPFIVVSLRDVSADKRREALEHVFFHDVLNTVTGLRTWTALLLRAGAQLGRPGERVDALTRRLESEIREHRDLLCAERGTLSPTWQLVTGQALLDEAVAVFAGRPLAGDRKLVVERDSAATVETDPVLAVRVLANMVKNALEASEPGGTVRVRCEHLTAEDSGGARFTVHNAGAIPPEVQARIFQRSFTTKAGRGRGLGTYGMKLIGERFLGGRVVFRSEADAGTVFTFSLPPRALRSPGVATHLS